MKTKRIRVTRNAAALLVAFGTTTPAMAAVCNDVTFTFTNATNDLIQVTKVGYRDLNSSNPNTRRVDNISTENCASEDTCTTNGEDLGSIAKPRENHDLTDIQFWHSHNLGSYIWSTPSVVADHACHDNHNYGPFDVN